MFTPLQRDIVSLKNFSINLSINEKKLKKKEEQRKKFQPECILEGTQMTQICDSRW